jgi:topoisomerase-4 subunit A
MNVLDKRSGPARDEPERGAAGWLDHQQDVLVRRSHFRLDKIIHRLEVLEGYLIVVS